MARRYDLYQPKEMFKISEMAEILGVTKKVVYRMIDKGELEYIRFGRKGDGGYGEIRVFMNERIKNKYIRLQEDYSYLEGWEKDGYDE